MNQERRILIFPDAVRVLKDRVPYSRRKPVIHKEGKLIDFVEFKRKKEATK